LQAFGPATDQVLAAKLRVGRAQFVRRDPSL